MSHGSLRGGWRQAACHTSFSIMAFELCSSYKAKGSRGVHQSNDPGGAAKACGGGSPEPMIPPAVLFGAKTHRKVVCLQGTKDRMRHDRPHDILHSSDYINWKGSFTLGNIVGIAFPDDIRLQRLQGRGLGVRTCFTDMAVFECEEDISEGSTNTIGTFVLIVFRQSTLCCVMMQGGSSAASYLVAKQDSRKLKAGSVATLVVPKDVESIEKKAVEEFKERAKEYQGLVVLLKWQREIIGMANQLKALAGITKDSERSKSSTVNHIGQVALPGYCSM